MHILLAQNLILSKLTFLAPHLTETERIKKLEKFFSPSFQEILTIDEDEELSQKRKHASYDLRGYIELSPPKDYCFIVQKKSDDKEEEISICKKKKIPFKIKDLDHEGKLHFFVLTGPNDFGTKVSWQTEYSLGRFSSYKMSWPGPSKMIPIKKCKALITKESEKIIFLSMFHDTRWIIKLPIKESLVDQPKRQRPNLYVQKSEFASSFVKVSKEKEQNLDDSEKQDSDPNSIMTSWQMHPRNSYYLEGSKFIMESSNPKGMQGNCRYRYSEYEYNKKIGAIECHHVGVYRWLYLPLSCISDFKNKNLAP